MVFDIGCLRVKLIFSRGNYDTHCNKRKSEVSERILITKTNVCVHSVPLQPSGGASVDEYECVQNEISYETTYCIVFLRLCNLPTFLNSQLFTPEHLARLYV